jgi:hypothetical protein
VTEVSVFFSVSSVLFVTFALEDQTKLNREGAERHRERGEIELIAGLPAKQLARFRRSLCCILARAT